MDHDSYSYAYAAKRADEASCRRASLFLDKRTAFRVVITECDFYRFLFLFLFLYCFLRTVRQFNELQYENVISGLTVFTAEALREVVPLPLAGYKDDYFLKYQRCLFSSPFNFSFPFSYFLFFLFTIIHRRSGASDQPLKLSVAPFEATRGETIAVSW
jgi:hypothetical protein